ncbi:hypothetical protein ACWFZ6_06965 [Methylorubrum extorquens]
MKIGPTFAREIAAAGLAGLPSAWSADGVTYGEDLAPADRVRVEAVLAAHKATRALPPEVISGRQFAQALALAGTITEAEALAWAARGELPDAMETALDQVPDAGNQRFGARMMLAGATTFERHHPLTEQLGTVLGYDAAALDALWTRAASL